MIDLVRPRTAALFIMFALLTLPASMAAAAEAPPVLDRIEDGQMRAGMHRYFAGERSGGIWLMSVGAPLAGLGAGLFFPEGAFYRGMAYPLLAIGVVEIVAGAMFIVNSNRRVARFGRQLSSHPAAFREAELSRMRRVNREMRFMEILEIGLILFGGAMTSVAALQGEDLLAGIGTGVMLQSAVLLVYDQLAARRALRYSDSLTRFGVGVTGGPGLAPRGALLTVLQAF